MPSIFLPFKKSNICPYLYLQLSYITFFSLKVNLIFPRGKGYKRKTHKCLIHRLEQFIIYTKFQDSTGLNKRNFVCSLKTNQMPFTVAYFLFCSKIMAHWFFKSKKHGKSFSSFELFLVYF